MQGGSGVALPVSVIVRATSLDSDAHVKPVI